MDLVLRSTRLPMPLPRAAVVRGRLLQQRLGRWSLRCGVSFAVLASVKIMTAAVGWQGATDQLMRLEWVGGLLALAAMACAAGWCLAESHYGEPDRPATLARLCRLRSHVPEVDRYLQDVTAQGRTLTNAEAYALLQHYAAASVHDLRQR